LRPILDLLRRHPYPVLLLLGAVLLLAGVDCYSLLGSTEPREAGIAAAMLQDQQYIVPTLNQEAFLEKPPLSYWLQSAAMHIGGATPLAARLPSILAALGCVWLLFASVRRTTGDERAAWIAALALLTMASFWMNARTAGQDLLLTFGIALALFGFYGTRETPSARGSWPMYAAGIAVATLSKGVVGLALPGVVIFAFLLFETLRIERRFKLRVWLLPGGFALLGLIPFALWLLALHDRTGMDAVREILLANSIDRFAGSYTRGAHDEPFYFYLLKLPETFAPWNLLLAYLLWRCRRELARNWRFVFSLCWLVAPYLLLSLSAGKRPSYLLALYPGAALFIALGVDHWLRSADQPPRALAKLTAPLLALLAALYIGYGSIIMPRNQNQDSPAEMFAQLRHYEQDGHTVLLFNPLERISGAARFYLQHPVPAFAEPQALLDALHANPAAIALTGADDLAGLHGYRTLESFAGQKRKYAIIAAEAE